MKPTTKTLLIALLFSLFFHYPVKANDNFSFLSQIDYPVDAEDLWGYAKDGKEYAILGLADATVIIDITDPSNPVELFKVRGAKSDWRDVKTYDHYAYIVHDRVKVGQTNDGLLIIDLEDLPNSIETSYWTGDEDINLKRAHNVYIDEKGFLYLLGSNHKKGGAIIADLKDNPLIPNVVGVYDSFYVHDAFVRDDILWTAEINDGTFSAVDVSDRANPIVLASQKTPRKYTHNVWLSDDGNTLFTTDEKSAAPIAAYDVSNLNEIEELFQFRNLPESPVIPHNVYVKGDYILASMYKDGVIIADASDPENIIRIASYDTAPEMQGTGFNGCWGVYPYLPSGNIIASDISGGLFILEPNYYKACYLEGNITDATTNSPINEAKIEILNTTGETNAKLDGSYKTGFAESGLYSVRITKIGYFGKTIDNVELINGQVTNLDVALENAVTGIGFFGNNFELLNNPVGSYLQLKGEKMPVGPVDLRIFGISGDLVKSETFLSSNNLILTDVSNLPKGLYILELSESNHPIFRSKIIKE